MMFKLTKTVILPALLMLASCVKGEIFPCMCEAPQKQPQCVCPAPVPVKSAPRLVVEPQAIYANDQNIIVLQDQTSRIVATCYTTADVTAETCARAFEAKGYVRLSEIPYKPANYDFLKTDTYPTRRWRGGELTPRW